MSGFTLLGEEAGWNRASCRLLLLPQASVKACYRPWASLLERLGNGQTIDPGRLASRHAVLLKGTGISSRVNDGWRSVQ